MKNKAFYLFLGLIIIILNYACKIDEPSIPEPTGVSGSKIFITLTATPDILVINGTSTSSIDAKVSDYTGKPLAGKNVQFEILNINLWRVDIGRLAKGRVATNSDGVAHNVYKVPSLNEHPAEVTLAIKATLVDAEYPEQFSSITYLFLILPDNVPKPLPYNCDATAGGPQPFIQYSPSSPKANQRINFSGATSYDPDGVIISFDWNFGDGRTASGVNVWHSYSLEGTYNVVLVVTDNNHNACPTSTTVTVGAVIGCSITAATAEANKPASITISINSGVPNYTIDVDFGDGNSTTIKTASSSITINHVYSAAGSYVITASVRDQAGRTYVCTGVIAITPPTTAFGCNVPAVSGTAGSAVSISVSITGGTPNYTININYGDGNSASITTSSTSATFSHIYAAPGTYNISVNIVDGNGNTTSCSNQASIT